MIWALLGTLVIALFVAGDTDSSRLDALRDGVEKNVKDEARLARAIAALDVAGEAIAAARKQQAGISGDLEGALSRPDATAEELSRALARVDAIEADTFNKLVAARRSLVSSTTPQEWALLFPAPAPEGHGEKR
jgi:hypothetical protein